MSTVILSAGSSVIVVIAVAVWLVSMILKTKKKAKTFIHTSSFEAEPEVADPAEEIPTDGVELSQQERNRRHRQQRDRAEMNASAEGGRSVDVADDEMKRMGALDDKSQESEYSLENPDDAKRAIIYSEILKPKF